MAIIHGIVSVSNDLAMCRTPILLGGKTFTVDKKIVTCKNCLKSRIYRGLDSDDSVHLVFADIARKAECGIFTENVKTTEETESVSCGNCKNTILYAQLFGY